MLTEIVILISFSRCELVQNALLIELSHAETSAQDTSSQKALVYQVPTSSYWNQPDQFKFPQCIWRAALFLRW